MEQEFNIGQRVRKRGSTHTGTVVEVLGDNRKIEWEADGYSRDNPKWCHFKELIKVE